MHPQDDSGPLDTRRSTITALVNGDPSGFDATRLQSVAARQHAGMFAALTGNETGIQYSGSVATFSAGSLSLLVAGRIRFRGEKRWWPLDEPERLVPLAADWRDRSIEALQRLLGNFVLIAIDRDRREVVAATDRLGEQTLYYAQSRNGGILLATRAGLLATHPLVRARLSRQALYNYLHFHMIPSPGTAYEGIGRLEPAQFLRYRGGRIELGGYWEPAFAADSAAISFPQLKDELLTTLAGSVRRSVERGRTGTFLSGGIDSSTVTGLLARESDESAPAYSVGFEAQGYDESRYAQIAAQHFGVPLRQFYITPADVQDSLMDVAAAYDEPFGNSSAIPTLACARRARSEGVERLLAGDGGDELFGGNTRYARQKVFEPYHRVPYPLRRYAVEPLLLGWELPSRIPVMAKVASYVQQARMPMPDRTDSYNFLVRTPLAEVFDPAFLQAVDPVEPFSLLRARYSTARTRSLVDRMLYLDWKFTLADNDLRKVGTMCELAGIEVRYPWLDDEVIELSTAIPPNWKVKGQTLRYFAKRALTGFLPDEVINKSKHGFGLPFGDWLKTSPPLQNQVYALLGQHKRRGVLRPDFIDALIEHHRDGHAAYYGAMVWVIAMLEAWLQAHGFQP